MTVQISTFENGPWQQNSYIVSNQSGQAILIDPGSDSHGICNLLQTLAVFPAAILNTHAHFDHIGAVVELIEKFEIEFYLHSNDEQLLLRANLYRLAFGGKSDIRIPSAFLDLDIHKNISIHGIEVEVLHTPGHTPGSVTFLIDGHLFTGDLLLESGPGRFDLPGGNLSDLNSSVALLYQYPENTRVFAGHGKEFRLSAIEE
jgi:hydroxyacylglutathione hydrolase